MADENNTSETTETTEQVVEETKPKAAAAEVEGVDEEEAEETKTAVELFRALKDPTRGKVVLEMLVREAGLNLDSKSDVKKAKNEILDILEESLPDNVKFLAKDLAPGLEKLLDRQRQQMEGRFNQISEDTVAKETDEAISFLSNEYNDFTKHTKSIAKLAKQLTPEKGMTQKQFLSKLYLLAKAEAGETVTKKDSGKGDRLKKATQDIVSRISPAGGTDKGNTSSRPLTRKQAIAEAFSELEAQQD